VVAHKASDIGEVVPGANVPHLEHTVCDTDMVDVVAGVAFLWIALKLAGGSEVLFGQADKVISEEFLGEAINTLAPF